MNDRLRISLRNPLIQRLRRHSQMAILFSASQSAKGFSSRVVQPLQADLAGPSETDFGFENLNPPRVKEAPEVTSNLEGNFTKRENQPEAPQIQRAETAPVKMAVPEAQTTTQRPGGKQPSLSIPEETAAISDENWKRLHTILQRHKEKEREEASSLADRNSGNQEERDVTEEGQSRPTEETGSSQKARRDAEVIQTKPEAGRKLLKSRVIELDTPDDFPVKRNQVIPEPRTAPFEEQGTGEPEAQSNEYEESVAETGENIEGKEATTIPEIARPTPEQTRHEKILPAAKMQGSSQQPGIQRQVKSEGKKSDRDLEDHSALEAEEAKPDFAGSQRKGPTSTVPEHDSSDVEQAGVASPEQREQEDFGLPTASGLQPIPLQAAWPVQRREEQNPEPGIFSPKYVREDLPDEGSITSPRQAVGRLQRKPLESGTPQEPMIEDGSELTGPAPESRQSPSQAMGRLQLNSPEDEIDQGQAYDDGSLADIPTAESTEAPSSSTGGLQRNSMKPNLHLVPPFEESALAKGIIPESSKKPGQPLEDLPLNSLEHNFQQRSSPEDRTQAGGPAQDLTVQREILPDEISQPEQISGEESSNPLAQRFPDPASQTKDLSTPRLVQTEIGMLPGDLWNLLEEEPPDFETQQGMRATPSAPMPASGSPEHFPPIPATGGMNIESIQREISPEDQPGEAAPSSTLPKTNAEQEADIVELASRVYAEIRNRISIEWERLRSR